MASKAQYKENAIKQIKRKLSHAGIDALLVTGESNIRYLTGVYFHGAMLLIAKKGQPYYFIDSMNKALLECLFQKVKLHVVPGGRSIAQAMSACVKKEKIKRLGFNSENLSVAGHDRLLSLAPKLKLTSKTGKILVPDILKDIRKIKTPEEINILRTAAKKTIRIWRSVKRNIKPGMTEKDIANMVDAHVREGGYENSFPTIAAIGKNTAYPHSVPTAKRLKKGEHVLIDFGIRYKGYCSDLTRTYDEGTIVRQIRDFRKIVRKAQSFAIKEIAPGVEIDSLVRKIDNVFNENKLGDFILHGPGHGIGLDIHEEPFLHKACRGRLAKGMVFTIEPGLYKPGVGGVRKEDMILVTQKGCEVLTR